MKTLLIMRHAKSSWRNQSLSDIERPLNKRGKRAAPKMGRMLAAEGLAPGAILSSTAERARRTAEAVADALALHAAPILVDALYLAPASVYIEHLARLEDDVERVLVVGHNPGVEELIAATTGVRADMPTAAVAHVQLPIDRWSALTLDTPGTLIDLWRPREIVETNSR